MTTAQLANKESASEDTEAQAEEIQLKKVIAFDSWTAGAIHVERLVSAFARHGIDLFLIHIGSWGHEQGRPREERIGRLRVRDISYYGNLSFKQILERERPDAVLFLSLQAFAHRSFNRYCAHMGIPTVHLYHGIVNVQDTASSRLNPLNVRSHLNLAFSRFRKNLSRTWPTYARALWETRAAAKDWLWFGYVVWRQIFGRAYTGIAAPDAITTVGCVYTDADIEHAVERYRIPREAVFAVGNPDLVRFGVTEKHLGRCLSSAWKPSKEVMYIDTALLEAGAVFDDASDFVQHLLNTRQTLESQGFRLVVKLHPAHFRTGVPELLKGHRVELCGTDDFLSHLESCCACVVEPSSLAVIPGLMGVPVFLAKYGRLKDQHYGDVLNTFPKARTLIDLGSFKSLLDRVEHQHDAESTKWIKRNAGPLPAEEMPDRVATIVVSMLHSSV